MFVLSCCLYFLSKIIYICSQVLRGVVRVELVETPDDYIPAVLERSKQKYIERTYRLEFIFEVGTKQFKKNVDKIREDNCNLYVYLRLISAFIRGQER